MEQIPPLDDILKSPLIFSLARLKEGLAEKDFVLTPQNYSSNEVKAMVVELAVKALGMPTEKETMYGYFGKSLEDIFAFYVTHLDNTWAFERTPKKIRYNGEVIRLTNVLNGSIPIAPTYEETLQIIKRNEEEALSRRGLGVMRARTPFERYPDC